MARSSLSGDHHLGADRFAGIRALGVKSPWIGHQITLDWASNHLGLTLLRSQKGASPKEPKHEPASPDKPWFVNSESFRNGFSSLALVDEHNSEAAINRRGLRNENDRSPE
jgi:hypothetical protein